MNKIYITGIILLLVSSCISMNQFVVTRLGDEPEGNPRRFIYSLPQTVVEVKLEYTKTTYKPGPYRQFTEKFLGMSQFISQEKTQWEITGAEMSGSSQPDASKYYSVNLLKGDFQSREYLEMSSKGLVIDPMGMISYNTIMPEKQIEYEAIYDLSLKQNHQEKVDTLFKTVIRDSSFVKIPILRKQKEAKTLEQKAEEAANLIIKIRKRRLKLIDGEYGFIPDGQALITAIEELNKTEKEYISLFTGKVFTEKFVRSYFVVPAGGNEKLVLTRFSSQKGIITKDSAEGQEVYLEINPLEELPEIIMPESLNQKNTLYYRIPVTCQVKLLQGNNSVYEGRISLYQSGPVLPLPVHQKGF